MLIQGHTLTRHKYVKVEGLRQIFIERYATDQDMLDWSWCKCLLGRVGTWSALDNKALNTP